MEHFTKSFKVMLLPKDMELEDRGRLKMLEQRCIEAKESLADIVSVSYD